MDVDVKCDKNLGDLYHLGHFTVQIMTICISVMAIHR